MSARQLMMKNPDLRKLPELVVPAGYELHTGREDSKAIWEEIVVSSFDLEMTYEEGLNYDNCGPDNCWFCAVDGVDVATATSYTRPDYPNAAFLHMVGTHKKGLRKGAGKLAVLAVLAEPFVKIGMQYLFLKASSAVCSLFADKSVCTLTEHFSAAMGLLLAMVATGGMLVFISTVCYLKGIG